MTMPVCVNSAAAGGKKRNWTRESPRSKIGVRQTIQEKLTKSKPEMEMLDAAIQSDLLKEVAQLPPALQRRVLDFARALAESTPQGVPGDALLQFAGIMTPTEADEFLRGIEEDCERVDPNEW